MADEKFSQVNVKDNVKQRIDVIAATERRFVYEVIEDMLKLYEHVVIKKNSKIRDGKKGKTNLRGLDTKIIRTELKELPTP